MAHKLTLKQVREFTKRMHFNTHLGIHVERVHKDGLTISLPLRDEFRNAANVLHGGLTATLADAAAGMSLVREFGGAMILTTIELKINYFRPIWGKKVFARCKLLRVGKQICVGSVDIHDDKGKHAGAALVTYMVVGPREDVKA